MHVHPHIPRHCHIHIQTHTHVEEYPHRHTHTLRQVNTKVSAQASLHTRAHAQHGELHGQARQTWRVITGLWPCCVRRRCSVFGASPSSSPHRFSMKLLVSHDAFTVWQTHIYFVPPPVERGDTHRLCMKKTYVYQDTDTYIRTHLPPHPQTHVYRNTQTHTYTH